MITDAFQKMVDKYKGDIFVSSDFRVPDSWDVGDMIYRRNPEDDLPGYGPIPPGTMVFNKENTMNISADYEGKIKRIGNQFLLKLGCQEFICQTLSDVGKKITAVLTEEYKKRDTPDEEA